MTDAIDIAIKIWLSIFKTLYTLFSINLDYIKMKHL